MDIDIYILIFFEIPAVRRKIVSSLIGNELMDDCLLTPRRDIEELVTALILTFALHNVHGDSLPNSIKFAEFLR
jgi:hypothetical protein